MLDKVKYSTVTLAILASTLIFASVTFAQNSRPSFPPGQMRSCQVKEAAIKERMTHLTKLATDMLNKFDQHATTVENFYTGKVLPSGKTVASYDSLVSEIGTKKAGVESALTTAQNDVNGFSCLNGHPKQDMTQFRKDMQDVKKALKDYRVAIKNLIVAVMGATK